MTPRTSSGRTIVNLSSGTPDDAVALAGEVHRRGGRYLDGAAMSGTRLVGEPSATFFYSGDQDAFDDARNVLAAFGKPLFLGADPAIASGYDTAVLGMILGFLTASYQATALLRRQGIDTENFPSVIRDYWPFVLDQFGSHETQIRTGSITPDDGTIDVYIDAAAAPDRYQHVTRRRHHCRRGDFGAVAAHLGQRPRGRRLAVSRRDHRHDRSTSMTTFEDIRGDVSSIISDSVYTTMTTVDRKGRPRSRALIVVWQLDLPEPVGWLGTFKTPIKAAHIANNPHVGTAYWSRREDAAYLDSVASWVDDPDTAQAVWDMYRHGSPRGVGLPAESVLDGAARPEVQRAAPRPVARAGAACPRSDGRKAIPHLDQVILGECPRSTSIPTCAASPASSPSR